MSCRVLIVEDEGLIAEDLAQRLTSLGYSVVGMASTADEALELAGQADIVLMDIRIDGPRDGIQAAEEIRGRHNLPVIFLSGHADLMTLERAKLAEPFGYLIKPLNSVALQAGIEIALHRHALGEKAETHETGLDESLAAASDAIILTDANSRIRRLNPAAEALTGWNQEEAVGRAVEQVVRLLQSDTHHGAADVYGDPVPLAMLHDGPIALESGPGVSQDRGLQLVRRDGQHLEVEGTAAPVRSHGEIVGGMLALRDVTARRWEERQLVQAQRLEAASRLAGRISNDYSTLIDSMRRQADDLARQLGEYAPARQAIEELQRVASSAAQTTRRLGAFGTRQVAHHEGVTVSALLRRMTRLIESVAGRTIMVQMKLEPGQARVRADAAQLEQAILNLVMHACAAMPEGGSLLVESSRTEAPRQGRIETFSMIRVAYSAVEGDLQRLMDPSGVEESGLALPVAHSIITEHDGYLTAHAIEEGTCLEILLPRIGVAGAGSEELAAPDLMQVACAAPVVLLVDPRDRFRAQLHNFFEAAGYNLMEASNREEAVALAAVHEGSIDLLIADEAEVSAIVSALREEVAWMLQDPEAPDELAVELMRDELNDKLAEVSLIRTLAIVARPEKSANEIRHPFTQQALLDRVTALLIETVDDAAVEPEGGETEQPDSRERAVQSGSDS
ncbi:MAG: response regulator [Acidobacteriota bacterium]